jgi:polysaccharide biosynthesis protein PslE
METEAMGQYEHDVLPYPLSSLRDILTALFKHKRKVLIVCLLVSGSIAGYVLSLVPHYDARAQLIMKLGRENIFRPEVGQANPIVEMNKEAALQSEISIITSKELVRQVVNTLGVEKIYPEYLDPELEIYDPVEKAVGTFRGKLSAKTLKGSNVIEVSYLNPNPHAAAEALNVLIELLKEKHLQVFSDPKASFLSQQLQAYQRKLEQSEDALQAFKQQHDLSSPLLEQQRRLLDQRAELDSRHKTIKNQLQGLEGRLASLDGQMKSILDNIPETTVEQGGNLEKAKSELFTLKREEQNLLTRYTETSFPVQNLRREIEQMEQFILAEQKNERANTIAKGKKELYGQLELERLHAMSEVTTLQESGQVIALQIQDLDKKIQRLDDLNKELIVLERQRDADEQNYKLYLNRVEEANVSEEMDRLKMSNISVIQHAEIPWEPAGRSPALLITLGTIFGIMVGTGLGLLLEYFEGAYTRPDQAANDLNLPLLGSFSQKLS